MSLCCAWNAHGEVCYVRAKDEVQSMRLSLIRRRNSSAIQAKVANILRGNIALPHGLAYSASIVGAVRRRGHRSTGIIGLSIAADLAVHRCTSSSSMFVFFEHTYARSFGQ